MEVVQEVAVNRDLPSAQSDAVTAQGVRVNTYREQMVQNVMPTKHALADEGTYFTFANPTPGTGIAYGATAPPTGFSDTVPFFLFYNSNPIGGKRICLDYLKLLQFGGTAPATTTSVQATLKIDNNRGITSAASTYTLIAPSKANGASNLTPSLKLYVPTGAVATIPAVTTAARVIGRAQLKGGPTLLLDEYTLSFGAVDGVAGGGYLTTVAAYNTRMPAFELAPQEYGILHLWMPGAATNPFTFEFEGGGWER